MVGKRIEYLDLVKLFTIYLVILGHVIHRMVDGYTVGGSLYDFIYSFHMPLFMLLSGYFVNTATLQKPLLPFLRTKSLQLLLPAISCTIIVCLYLYAIREYTDFRDEIIGNSWFLKTLFSCYVLFYLLKKTALNDWFLMVVSCIGLFLIPHATSLQVNLLFPYFWGGYMLRKYDVFGEIMFSRKWALVFIGLFVLAYSLQLYWKIPNYIPISVQTLPECWNLIVFRYIVSFLGSLSVICGISVLYEWGQSYIIVSRIAYFGRWTLGVYVLQNVIVENIFPDFFAWYVGSEFLLDAVIAPLLAFVFSVLCLYLIHILSKNRVADLLLFGGQYYKK